MTTIICIQALILVTTKTVCVYGEINVTIDGVEYCQALLDYLNSHQREDNGIRNEKCDYYGSNGLMKIVIAYTSLGKPVRKG